MWDKKIIAVTHRGLCREPLEEKLKQLAHAEISAVIIREKDLLPAQYDALSAAALPIFQNSSVRCILHHFGDIAKARGHSAFHCSLSELRAHPEYAGQFAKLGVSIHHLEEAKEAESLGATYLTAGHIFPTDCKKRLPPRGIAFLEEILSAVSIPVYAIGGINENTLPLLNGLPIAGICIMSGFMTAIDPIGYARKLHTLLHNKN